MSLRFQKRVEDFSCEHCKASVIGDGFTNHCPRCLWSKHVDVYPGDRQGICNGLMEPLLVVLTRDGYVIHHKCVACGFERKNKAASSDDIDTFLEGRRI